jgi:carboxylesterase
MTKKPLGALLLHGFSGKPNGLGHLAHHIETLGLPYRAPTLRGHGMDTPNALLGVKWTDWIADAEGAMSELLEEAEKVTIIGHSMGGMIALFLAAEHKEEVDSIIDAAGSTKGNSPFAPGEPLNFLASLIPIVKKKYEMPPLFADPDYARTDTGYAWVPTIAWRQVFDLMEETHKRLPKVSVPTLILHSKKDTVNTPEGAQILYDSIATPVDQKQLVWFEKTEHVMFLDCEEEEVNRIVVDYLQKRLAHNQ